MKKNITLALLTATALLATPARAEINDILTGPALVQLCKSGSEPDRTFCKGYLAGASLLLHTGQLQNYLPATQCFNVIGAIPRFETAVEDAFTAAIASTAFAAPAPNELAATTIARAVALAHPCTPGTNPALTEGNTQGTIPAE